MKRSGLRWVLIVSAFILTFFSIRYGNDLLLALQPDVESLSTGSISAGALRDGRRMPTTGSNFRTYSYFGSLIGRTQSHSRLRELVLESYSELKRRLPDACFTYGEMSWGSGGNMWPHRTHQNGLSIDFMVPVRTRQESVCLRTHIFNGWGYGLEFDSYGRLNGLSIDFEAVAMHIFVLSRLAVNYGIRINRIIFEPDYHPLLLKATYGKLIYQRLHFSRFKPWIRHDDHYHIDFEIMN